MSAKRVLVIDDDPSVRLLMEGILRALGAEVRLARSGAEGLGLLRGSRTDVLFIDVESPESDGVRIAREASSLCPRTSVVLVTDGSRAQSPIAAQHTGVCDRITRPITPEKIRTAMSRASAASVSAERAGAAFDEHGLRIGPTSHGAMVAASREMKRVLLLAGRHAETNVPVLIQGERGVGKALLARTIHHRRRHGKGAFLRLASRGIREDHAASLLSSAPGVGEASPVGNGDGGVRDRTRDGTLFLESVDELPSWAQFMLVEALERRAGTPSSHPRVIASTSCDLQKAVSEGRLSQELYYLLSVAVIPVPPLRRRREDVRPLAEHMLERFVRQSCRSAADCDSCFSNEAWDCLTNHDWPGNGDELANVLQRAVLLGKTSRIEAADLEPLLDKRSVGAASETITVPFEGDFREIQRQIIREAINRCSGNKAAAARALGLHRKTIYRLLQGGEPPSIVGLSAEAGGIDVPVAAQPT